MPFPKPVLRLSSSSITLSPLDVVRKHLLQPRCSHVAPGASLQGGAEQASPQL